MGVRDWGEFLEDATAVDASDSDSDSSVGTTEEWHDRGTCISYYITLQNVLRTVLRKKYSMFKLWISDCIKWIIKISVMSNQNQYLPLLNIKIYLSSVFI